MARIGTLDILTHFYCSHCKNWIPRPAPKNGGGTGYVVKRNGHKVCYQCCAVADKQRMEKAGSATLYLVTDTRPQVMNWPGTLRFNVINGTSGRHNIAGRRFDVWFHGPDGYVWHGTQYGESTQLCHCRRTKETCYPNPGQPAAEEMTE